MPSDPTKRIASWNTKFNTERVKAILDEKRPDMLTGFSAATMSQYTTDTEVRQVCDAAGVSIIQLPFYLDFGREMWRLKRTGLSGSAMAEETAVLIGKWVARGLTQAVLETIRTQVFDVAAPAP